MLCLQLIFRAYQLAITNPINGIRFEHRLRLPLTVTLFALPQLFDINQILPAIFELFTQKFFS